MIYISIVVQLSRKIIKHFYNEPVYVADGGETMAYSELIKNFNSKVHEEQEFAGGLKISWVADDRCNICQACFVEKGCV